MSENSFLTATGIADLWIIQPRVFEDKRGFFFESYNKKNFEKNNLHYNFVQDNQARSVYGVLRGLHYQTGEAGQAKLVSVAEGEVLDVVVDIRPNSETYGRSFSVLLSGKNKKQLLIPRGFAHGYVVISKTALFCYKCDNYYNKEAEGGIRYNDTNLNIDWLIPEEHVIISEKDEQWPFFGKHQ